ncbi:MAG: hypothetical protein AAFN50_00205 [Pseudomonadota bacterium]
MKALLVAIFMVLTGVGIACAGEAEEKFKIKVVKSGDDGEHTSQWVGDPGELDGLEVGESKTLEDGVVVTRTEEGLSFNINGEVVDVPKRHGRARTMAIMHKEGHDDEIEVEVIKGGPHMAVRAHKMHDGIMIASGEAIDESTQETIRSVLASAGYESEVRFIDRASMHAKHVTVIEERIEEVHED